MFNINTFNIILILVPFVIFLLSLIYLLTTYFRRREHLLKATVIVFIIVFLTVIAKIIFASGMQYYIWKYSENVSQYLLPPHQPINYFLRYSWQHFIMSPTIGILASLGLVLYFLTLNIIFKKQYLDLEDMLILVSGAMIVGWPNLIVYLGIAFVLTILRIFYLFYVKREMRRVPMTAALIIAAFITLLIGEKLVEILNIGFLKV